MLQICENQSQMCLTLSSFMPFTHRITFLFLNESSCQVGVTGWRWGCRERAGVARRNPPNGAPRRFMWVHSGFCNLCHGPGWRVEFDHAKAANSYHPWKLFIVVKQTTFMLMTPNFSCQKGISRDACSDDKTKNH